MTTRQRDISRLKVLLSQECARIMANEGVKDYLVAKRKAAARLGVTKKALLPSNSEIEEALVEYQRLFKSVNQPLQLRALREAAVQAMEFLARFQPRLVGSVLSGTAGSHSNVNLHVFADTPEEVVLFLMEHNIPFETAERRLRVGNGKYVHFPALGFTAGKVCIDLTVFPYGAEREAPRSPVDGRPMRRIGLAALRSMLNEEPQEKSRLFGPEIPLGSSGVDMPDD